MDTSLGSKENINIYTNNTNHSNSNLFNINNRHNSTKDYLSMTNYNQCNSRHNSNKYLTNISTSINNKSDQNIIPANGNGPNARNVSRYSNSNLQDAFKPYSRESNSSLTDVNNNGNVNARANMMKFGQSIINPDSR